MRQIPIQDLQWRHAAFLSMQPVDRPLLGLWVGDYYFTTQFPHGVSHWQAGAEIKPQELAFEQFLPDYQNLYELHERLNDDFFYVGSAYPGLPWMEAILGCPVFAEETSTWTKPFLSDYAQLDDLHRSVTGSPWSSVTCTCKSRTWSLVTSTVKAISRDCSPSAFTVT